MIGITVIHEGHEDKALGYRILAFAGLRHVPIAQSQ